MAQARQGFSQSSFAKGIQKRNGTQAAANYLRACGWHISMVGIVLCGKWLPTS
jgi:hypothetical protein